MQPLAAKLEAKRYGHEKTQAYLEEIAKAGAWDWKDEQGDPLPKPPKLDVLLKEGDAAKVGKLSWKVLHVPGHSRGSIAFVLKDRYAVVGDVLFAGSIGRTDLDTSDPELFARSLATKLWDLPDGVVVLPGHMNTTTIGEEKKANWLFQDFVRRARGESPIERPWLGVRLDGTYEGKGIRLGEITPGSPAAEAGLQAEDVIVAVDGKATETLDAFVQAYRRHAVGDTMALRVRRGEKELDLELRLGKRPPQ